MSESVSADPRVGTELAGYRIERLLGRGGMSVVYLAHDPRLDRRVALKLLAPELSGDERFRERFLRESRLAASLDHPNVIPIFEAGEAEGVLFIAMRFVEGGDLADRLAVGGRLDPAEAVSILERVADALDAAHRRGLVHRDVKPGNVLISKEDHVYLSDFGLTRRVEQTAGLTESGEFLGTVDYVAPEQIEGRDVQGVADEYALACVVFECLTGRAPFSGESALGTVYMHLHAERPVASEANRELPQGIDAVLARGMAKESRERYGSSQELISAVRDVFGFSEDIAERPPGSRLSRRRIMVVASGALAVIAVSVVAGVLLTRSSAEPEATAAPVTGPSSLVRIDAGSNQPVAAVELGSGSFLFVRLAIGGGAVWLANPPARTVSRVDASTNAVTRTIAARSSPHDIAVGAGTVWVVGSQDGAGVLTEIDVATGNVRATHELPYGNPVAVDVDGEARVWIAANDFSQGSAVIRLDGAEGRIVSTLPVEHELVDVLVVDDAVWATTRPPAAFSPEQYLAHRINPAANRIVATVELGLFGVSGTGRLAASADAIWALGQGLVRIDPETNRVVETVPIPRDAYALAATEEAVWLATGDGPGEVWRVSPVSNEVIARIVLDKVSVTAVAADEGAAWSY